MASDVKASPRHELFVDQQLERVSKRLHVLDLGVIALLLLAVAMAHALIMAMVDLTFGARASGWVPILRYALWGLSFAAFVYLGVMFLVRLYGKINPYYAAKQIEEAIPDAKNSVVNWLDLKEKTLSPAVKTALGLRAARDLKTTNPDESIHARKNTWVLAAIVSVLLVGLLVLLAREPGRFMSLMQRAFVPISELSLAKKTRITLLAPLPPASGPLDVEPRSKVEFQVRIHGEVPRINTPQAARLLYRYETDEAWLVLPLDQNDDGTWNASLLADQVRSGFTWKIAAGDDETKEYRVEVQAVLDARYEVSYRYQPYLRKPDVAVSFPNEADVYPVIMGPVGTEVTLVVKTNLELHNGNIELNLANGVKQLEGEILGKERNAFRVKFRLETSGKFRVNYVTSTGKPSNDANAYEVRAERDKIPEVVLNKPARDTLPANGVLQLEGRVTDDHGLKQIILKLEAMRGNDRIPVASKVYRDGNAFQFTDGSFARRLEYRDFVALSELKYFDVQQQELKKLELQNGDLLYFWLEATDHCDYPEPSKPGRSDIFKVKIGDPETPAAEQTEKEQARREQQQHEQRQDSKLKKEDQERRKQTDNPAAADQKNAAARAQEKKRVDDFFKNELDQGDPKQQPAAGQDQQTGSQQKKELNGKEVEQLKEMAQQNGAAGDAARRELQDAADKGNQKAKEALKNLPKPAEKQTTPQDVKDLKNLMDKNDGRPGQAAADKLRQIARDGTDKEIQKQANEALQQAKPGQNNPTAPKKPLTPDDFKQLEQLLKKDGALKDLAEKELKNAERSSDKEQSEAAKDALKNQPPPKLSPEDIEKFSKLLKDEGPLGQMARKELEKAANNSDKDAAEALKKTPNPASGQQQNQPQLSKDDFEAMKKALNDPGPLGQFARDRLKQALNSANDPATKKAIEDSLKDQKQAQPSAKDIEEMRKLADDPGPLGQMIREQMKKYADEATDKDARDAAKKAAEDAAQKNPPPPAGEQKQQPPTEKDIAKLDRMQDKPGAQGTFARDKLKDIANGAGDDKTRAEAKKALERAQNAAAEKATAEDVDKLKQLAKGNGPVAEDAKKELKRIEENAKAPDARKGAKEALQQLRSPVDAARDEMLMQADPTRNVTRDQIDELKKQARKKGLLGEDARAQLEEAQRLAKDPDVRKAARDALEDLAKQKRDELTPDDVAILGQWAAREKGPRGEAAARELEWLKNNAADPKLRDAAAEAMKELPTPKTGNDPIKNAKIDDVKRLEKDINKEGLLGEQADRALSEIERLADDARVRQAAKEARGKRDPLKQEALTPADVDKLGKALHDDWGPGTDAVAREMVFQLKNSKNDKVREALLDRLKKENIDPQTMSKEKHGGSLTLEALKRIPREVVENELKLNWEEWQRRLEAMDPQRLRGDPSKSGNTAPARAEPSGANSTNSQGNLGTAPPGYGDAFIRWTTGRSPDRKP